MGSTLTSRHLPPRAHLTPAEVADFLGLSVRYIYYLISMNEMPHVRFGRVIRIPRDQFDTWYESFRAQPVAL